jgi:biotin synthase-like enzyme
MSTRPGLTEAAVAHYRSHCSSFSLKRIPIHREFHSATEIQKCALFSITTGRRPENCGYCSQ